MPAHAAECKAGQFAAERYDLRHRAWLRRVWWVLPLVALPLVAIFVMFGLLFQRQHMEFFWGLGFGAGFTFAVALAQSPPAHIERWRLGAEGERATARALRTLVTSGWVLINDVQRDRGNIDHILVGPAGVFVLETKNLSGRVSAAEDVLRVRYRVDPDDGYVLDRVGTATRGRAASLQAQLRGAGARPAGCRPSSSSGPTSSSTRSRAAERSGSTASSSRSTFRRSYRSSTTTKSERSQPTSANACSAASSDLAAPPATAKPSSWGSRAYDNRLARGGSRTPH